MVHNVGFPPGWSADDVALFFDILEYLYHEVTIETKRAEFRQRINPDLALYTPPMEMTSNGQIVAKLPDELDALVAEPIEENAPTELLDPLEHAVQQYRRRGATDEDKRSALLAIIGVIEPLRDDIKKYALPADESALFNIANNFGLRHTGREQHRDFDRAIWLEWLFYVYLATARAMLAVLSREELAARVHRPVPGDAAASRPSDAP